LYFSGPNILLSLIFSNTLSLRSSSILNGKVSHPQKITAKLQFHVLLVKSSLISKHVVHNTVFDISTLCAFQPKHKKALNA
jgi:hypothetical protein